METYKIRVRSHDNQVSVLEVSFSQLCEYLPPRHRNEQERIAEKNFFQKISAIEGPRGNVKLL